MMSSLSPPAQDLEQLQSSPARLMLRDRRETVPRDMHAHRHMRRWGDGAHACFHITYDSIRMILYEQTLRKDVPS